MSSQDAVGGPSPRSSLAAAGVCVVLALLWVPSVSMERALGWDESMHAGYPAARVALALRDVAPMEALRAVHDCALYPPAYPVVLGVLEALLGLSESLCRVFGRVLWCVGLFGIFRLAGSVARRASMGRGADLAPWLALGLAALSPMALAYSGSLFLEVPFAAVSVFALRAWLRRGDGEPLRREVAAGAWLALAFFVKFNYGALLGFALAVDLAFQSLGEVRAGRGRDAARRALALAGVPLVLFAWWFLLPVPFGSDVAAAHRDGFAHFLTGNRDPSMHVPWSLRAMHWTCFLVPTPRVLVVLVLGCLAALPLARRGSVRTMWMVLVAAGLPVWTHNFHQDRFLLPGLVPLACLAGVGLARLLPAGGRARAIALAALGALALAFPSFDGPLVMRAVGLENAALADYQLGVLAGFRDLSGDREIPTNGLARGESDALLALVEPVVRPGTRVAWVGVSTVFSPAAMHLGLVERGAGAPDAIRAGALDRTFVELGFVDPEWDDARLAAWADGFGAVLATEPIDMTGNARRAFLAAYRDRLVALGWTREVLGTFAITRPLRDPQPVEVSVLRPAR